MSSPETVKRAVAVVCGVSALVCASAAGYFWYRKRRYRKKTPKSKSPASNRQGSPRPVRRNLSGPKNDERVRNESDDEHWSEGQRDEDDYTSDLSSSEESEETALKYRGRKNYRKSKSKSGVQERVVEKTKTSALEQGQQPSNKKQETSKPIDSTIVGVGPSNGRDTDSKQAGATNKDRIIWGDEVERSVSTEGSEPEITSAALNSGMAKSTSGARMQQTNGRPYGEELNNGLNGAAVQNGGIPQHIVRNQHAPSPAVSSVKSQCADSPSLGSDLHSEVRALILCLGGAWKNRVDS